MKANSYDVGKVYHLMFVDARVNLLCTSRWLVHPRCFDAADFSTVNALDPDFDCGLPITFQFYINCYRVFNTLNR